MTYMLNFMKFHRFYYYFSLFFIQSLDASGIALDDALAATVLTSSTSSSGAPFGSLLIVGPPTTTFYGVMFQIFFVLVLFSDVISSISHVIGLPKPGSLHLIGGLNVIYKTVKAYN